MEQLKSSMAEAEKKVPVHEFDLVASSSSSSFESENSNESSLVESHSFEEVTSSASSSSSSAGQVATDPLSDMSSLFQQLPTKRGLSKFYQGKAQSFTSLAKVTRLEDLAKPENPYNKKLKSCRSHGGKMGESHNAKCTTPSAISRHGSKRGLHSTGSRGSCSSLSAKRGSDNNFMGSRPPISPHRSTSSSTIPNQTVLLV